MNVLNTYYSFFFSYVLLAQIKLKVMQTSVSSSVFFSVLTLTRTSYMSIAL